MTQGANSRQKNSSQGRIFLWFCLLRGTQWPNKVNDGNRSVGLIVESSHIDLNINESCRQKRCRCIANQLS